MKTTDTILIADRNPHVSDFLRRELADSGYHVRSVHNTDDLLQAIYSDNRISLLVLDPDFPCPDTRELAHKIAGRIPQISVVLHCVTGSESLAMFDDDHVVSIEKNGCSVETLKKAIRRLL
jgi:DNA-binding NtrC family response regulator